MKTKFRFLIFILLVSLDAMQQVNGEDAASFMAAKNLLTNRLDTKRFAWDGEVEQTFQTFVSSATAEDTMLWVRCSLFYTAESIRTDRISNSQGVLLIHPTMNSDFTGRTNLSGEKGIFACYALLFRDSKDPFIRCALASLTISYNIAYLLGIGSLKEALTKLVDGGQMSKVEAAEFLATVSVPGINEISLLNFPEAEYGELGLETLGWISQRGMEVPWLRDLVRANRDVLPTEWQPPAEATGASATNNTKGAFPAPTPDRNAEPITPSHWLLWTLAALLGLGAVGIFLKRKFGG